MNDVDSVYDRLRTDPLPHLGRRGVRLIIPYEFGYELGRKRLGWPLLPESLGRRGFQDWVEVRFGWTSHQGCRQNAASFAELLTADDAAAFDFYFELRAAAKADHVRPTADGLEGATWRAEGDAPTPATLVDWLIDDHFRTRASMYIGGRCLDALWAMCSGYLWAERDAGIAESADARTMAGFQAWTEARFPFAAGRPWNKVFNFLCLNDPARAWAATLEAFDAHRAGDAPDAMSDTGKTVLAAITRAVQTDNPDATIHGIAAKFGDAIKGIAPT